MHTRSAITTVSVGSMIRHLISVHFAQEELIAKGGLLTAPHNVMLNCSWWLGNLRSLELTAMANKEHLSILRHEMPAVDKIAAWNKWRDDNPLIDPDLSNADLRRIDVGGQDTSGLSRSGLPAPRGINLIRTNLSGADLRKANLSKAVLDGADLSRANLSEAYLMEVECDNSYTSSGTDKTTFHHADLSFANLNAAALSNVDLSGANLSNACLYRTDLSWADLSNANLSFTQLEEADLRNANLSKADLSEATLQGATLINADLSFAYLRKTDLRGANLGKANLSIAQLVKTDLTDAIITDCLIFGVSAWGVKLDGAEQKNLIVTPYDELTITVDHLEVAQFIYLLLNNQKIRHVIDTIAKKVVLILGRFSAERKEMLEVIREELRRRDYLPILLDFEKPSSRDLTETISTLAHIARFVIADITDAKSVPQELQRIVPSLPSVPVQPLLLASSTEYDMFEHFKKFPWVLETYRYNDSEDVISSVQEKIIAPAEAMAKALLTKS